MQDLLVIIPAYNEASVIGPIIQRLSEREYRVLVVDDGSQDQTASIARENGAEVVSHLINLGVGAAIGTGIELARQRGVSMIVMMDGDGQHHLEDIEALVEPLLRDQADVVIGSRFLRQNEISLLRRTYNRLANVLTYLLSGVWVSDSQSGMRAFGRRALEELHIDSNRFEFATEMFSQIRYLSLRYTEVPIKVTYTAYSMSKGQNFLNGIETVFRLVVRSLMR